MKSLLLFIALFSVGACGYGQTYATVLADTLKIYESATTDAAVICTRGKGATIQIISTDDETHFSFIKSCLDGRPGYVPTYQLSTRRAPAENVAYVCNGRYSKKYHSYAGCRGLNACKSSLSKMNLSDARTMYDACSICH